MCIVALIAGGEGRTMSECNKLLPSLSSVHIPVLQPIILMQMVRVSFDALISLPAVSVPWWLPAVHRKAHWWSHDILHSFLPSCTYISKIYPFCLTCGFWHLPVCFLITQGSRKMPFHKPARTVQLQCCFHAELPRSTTRALPEALVDFMLS